MFRLMITIVQLLGCAMILLVFCMLFAGPKNFTTWFCSISLALNGSGLLPARLSSAGSAA